ncbi:hypothetical protein S245_029513, partial [Arachis hypogaea]
VHLMGWIWVKLEYCIHNRDNCARLFIDTTTSDHFRLYFIRRIIQISEQRISE